MRSGATARRRLLTVLALAVCVFAVGAVTGATAHPQTNVYAGAHRCARYTVGHQHWGAYVERGRVTCATAVRILRAVQNGAGADHEGAGFADSYTLYRGWRCGGQMGFFSCTYPNVPV